MTYKYISYLKKYYKIALLILLGSFFIVINLVSAKEPVDTTHEIFKYSDSKEETKEDISKEKTEIFVDVKGKVVNPGVYEMNEGDRVIDAVIKAEGLKEEAFTLNVNLAKRIVDEMVIIIPSIHDKEIEAKEELKEEVTSNLININTASQTELTNLPKIGESKAEDIISYRNTNGNFKNIIELKNVSGIGDAIYNEVKDLITI